MFQQVVGFLPHRVSPQTTDGVLGNGHGKVRHAQGPSLGLAQVDEQVATDRHGGDAPALQLYRIVDTPRRTRPSITQADNSHIHRRGELVQNFPGGRDR